MDQDGASCSGAHHQHHLGLSAGPACHLPVLPEELVLDVIVRAARAAMAEKSLADMEACMLTSRAARAGSSRFITSCAPEGRICSHAEAADILARYPRLAYLNFLQIDVQGSWLRELLADYFCKLLLRVVYVFDFVF